jgi:hypothetical protein
VTHQEMLAELFDGPVELVPCAPLGFGVGGSYLGLPEDQMRRLIELAWTGWNPVLPRDEP